MDDGASFAALPLPLVHLGEQVEESLLGVGDVTIGRPAQELELTDHQLALLELVRGEGGGMQNFQTLFQEVITRLLCCIALFKLRGS